MYICIYVYRERERGGEREIWFERADAVRPALFERVVVRSGKRDCFRQIPVDSHQANRTKSDLRRPPRHPGEAPQKPTEIVSKPRIRFGSVRFRARFRAGSEMKRFGSVRPVRFGFLCVYIYIYICIHIHIYIYIYIYIQ